MGEWPARGRRTRGCLVCCLPRAAATTNPTRRADGAPSSHTVTRDARVYADAAAFLRLPKPAGPTLSRSRSRPAGRLELVAYITCTLPTCVPRLILKKNLRPPSLPASFNGQVTFCPSRFSGSMALDLQPASQPLMLGLNVRSCSC